jgi:hypothetical protein
MPYASRGLCRRWIRRAATAVAGCSALLALASPVRADPVHWQIDGTIARVGEELAPGQPLGPDTAAIAAIFAGKGVQAGAAWTADLFFDGSADPLPQWSPYAVSVPANVRLSFEAGGFSAASPSAGGSGPATYDLESSSLTFFSPGMASSGLPEDLFLQALGLDGLLQGKVVLAGPPFSLAPSALPADPPDLGALSSGTGLQLGGYVAVPANPLASFMIEGTITEIHRVPEPSVTLLAALASALCARSATRRGRRARASPAPTSSSSRGAAWWQGRAARGRG